MELFDFYFGIAITVIAVVVIEYTIHFLKESSANDQIIKSLLGEVSLNLYIVRTNKEFMKKKDRRKYLNFKVDSYQKFRLLINQEIINKLNVKATGDMYSCYLYCEYFNSLKKEDSAILYEFEGDGLFDDIERKFNYFYENWKK